MHLSETPVELGKYSNIGRDNPYVFEELLGMPPSKVRRLMEAEVIY